MAELQKIRIKYPDLFEKLEIELPSHFFEEPEASSVSVKRRYNDIVSGYLCKSGDIFAYKDLQMILTF